MTKTRRGKGTGTLLKLSDGGPWVLRWTDASGKRRQQSSGTTDKATARRILDKIMADAALRREGVVDASRDRYVSEGRKPLTAHLSDYLAHCEHAGYSDKHLIEKRRHLGDLLRDTGATHFAELTADTLTRYLAQRRAGGWAARTVNMARQTAVAFVGWAVKMRRVESNPLSVVSKLDEDSDRRHVRRALTDDELGRLLDVAAARGRKAWYMAAAHAGLRRGDLARPTWGDVDFDGAKLTIRGGKSKRVDEVSMHPELADALCEHRGMSIPSPKARVFPTVVTCQTQQLDFLRAGIARREPVVGPDGEVIMLGKGKRRRPKTRIVTTDEYGRVVDLHALRTTLGTKLARAGVAPQLAQRILRHSDYRTTLKHYTALLLADTAAAVNALPSIGRTAPAAAKSAS